MAKTYFSNTPPGVSAPTTAGPSTSISTSTVNIPGDYLLNANPGDGKITLKAGEDGIVTLKSGALVIIDSPLTEVFGDTTLGVDIGQNILDLKSKVRGDIIPEAPETYDLGEESATWNKLFFEEGEFFSEKNVENPFGFEYDPDDVFGTEFLGGNKSAADAQRREGAAFFAGGVGIQKDLNVGGTIYGRITIAQTSLSVLITSTNIDQEFYPLFALTTGQQFLRVDEEGAEGGLTYNPAQGKLTTDRILVAETDAATVDEGALRVKGGASIELNVVINGEDDATADTGAVVVAGGISVGKNIWVNQDAYVELIAEAGEVNPHADDEGNIGTTSTAWAEGYINELYTKIIRTTTGTLTISPQTPLTDVYGDIRVRGTNPVGTAPVVSNVLYVTVDGSDTNDGRAQDSSRACRTIGGAINSPFYQPGTQILVSAGTYLEDNPLRLKPYTSIRGSDIRTTFIEPINKTQDLFHLDSGCYLNYMTFLNGRSGLLKGPYDERFNRGAYATAFPPLGGEERIDLFHSPYVQNCTNQSGPWLTDGTMFVPNQTVQIPIVVGTGSWLANTTSIVVSASTGTITRGMSISDGQQNLGFFNARTLMLANKPFIQDQVVAFVDQTFSSGSFTYDEAKCQRDLELIVDSISLDLLYNSDSDSIFAGLQYWNQDANTEGIIPGEYSTTTAAITYVKGLAIDVATSAGGASEGSTVSDRFDNILNILSSGTAGVSDIIIPNSLPTTATSTVLAVEALLAQKETIQSQTLSYLDTILTPFTYDQAKCSRDTGLIIDAIAQDILFSGDSQSNFAGLQYWNQSGYVDGIADEITTTTAAISYVKELAAKLIVNDITGTRYQSAVVQDTRFTPATSSEVLTVESEFDIILNILSTGTAGVSDLIVPNGLTASADTDILNAYQILQVNKDYIKAEAIAFVEATKTPEFTYDQTLCARDVGFMIDSVSFDLLYGGNKQAVQSGVYYYGFNPSSSAIASEIPQTTAAYDYIRDLLSKVVRSIPIDTANLYQTDVPQVLGNSGSQLEVFEAEEKIDLIVNIILNGPSAAGPREPISLTRSTEEFAINAALILNANRDFFKAEIIAYADTLKEFVFDREKCFRDIGYMVDSVAFDLLHGGNKQSIKSGVYYFGYTDDTAVPNEIPQVTSAYNYLKTILPSIVKGQLINKRSTNLATQITALPIAGNYEGEQLQTKIDVITEIIRNGPSAARIQESIGFNLNPSEEVVNAFNMLAANTAFIQAEVTAYINETFGTFEYSRASCRRDVGILVENVAYDVTFGGNLKTVESGLAYYDGVISRISGQETQTISAIDYLSDLARKVITNTTCTDLFAVGTSTTTATSFQVINTVLTGGEIASRAIEDSFNVITNIIANGPDAAPTIYSSNGPDAAYVSAEVLMEANREFIQQDTINYVNNLVQTFPYSEIKCRRDTKLIVDAISQDLLYPTAGMSQSTFAGIQYWSQGNYTGEIAAQIQPIINAVTYLKELSVKIVQNITPNDDLVNRYQFEIPQVTNLESASEEEGEIISADYDVVLEILGGQKTGWTDRIISNGTATTYAGLLNAFDLLQANKTYMAAEVLAFVTTEHPNFTFNTSTYINNFKSIVDAISYDLVHGGNKQSVQAGLYYYTYTGTDSTVQGQEVQTVAAYQRIYDIVGQILLNQPVARSTGNNTLQILSLSTATAFEVDEVRRAINTITNIISSGTVVAAAPSNISLTASTTSSVFNGYLILQANRDFIADEVISYIDNEYNPTSFNYDEAKCYRDVGLIIDAVSQDVLLGGNQKSIEAGLAYWSAGYNYVTGQETTTTMAINHAKDISLKIIANRPVEPQPGTVIQQIINPYFQYGNDYMPQQAVARNFNIITNIIEKGPLYAPPIYAGGGLFALTGLNGADVKIGPRVASVTTLSSGTFLIGLNTATVGFGNNATLYFGDTQIFPLRDRQVEQLSLEYTGNTSTWNSRKIDTIGSMGGSLVDGAVISDRSPIQSFVYDAYTQVNQGGRGVHIKNDGYAQLVSVFTVFCSIGVEVESGGIASIVNSNANFGDICLQARGYGKRKFTGHVYNPVLKSYPESPDIEGSDFFDQYYPTGFWPNDARVRVFLPDLDDRPHISLVMEVVPPEVVTDFTGAQVPQLNEQGFPGFLNAIVTTSTLNTGSLTISGIDTTGIAVGNSVFIRDINESQTGTNGILYADTGTVVADVTFQSITLNKALTNGGSDPTNPEFFDLYISGNAYYTVLSSEVGENPKYNRNGELIPAGVNILSTASTGLPTSQVGAHISSLQRLQTILIQIINNDSIIRSTGNTSTQTKLPLVVGGGLAEAFINQRFNDMINIIDAIDLAAAENVVRPSQRTQTGPAVQGAGAAISLIEANIEFLADEISAYVQSTFAFTPGSEYDDAKCQRDVKIILQRLIYDIETGGRYNSVMVGLSYWNRAGTFHVVQLGENVSRTDLFPDGATVNFYQRSYMSASSYVFEYVGAGIDYGALPQRGIADPDQSKEVVMLDSGKVFFTSTDQNGDFRIGPGLVISQATGVLSGRTFTRSLFANLTPFILAIESGG